VETIRRDLPSSTGQLCALGLLWLLVVLGMEMMLGLLLLLLLLGLGLGLRQDLGLGLDQQQHLLLGVLGAKVPGQIHPHSPQLYTEALGMEVPGPRVIPGLPVHAPVGRLLRERRQSG